MLRAFLNWLKSLFSCFFRSRPAADNNPDDALPLLANADEHEQQDMAADRVASTGNILLGLHEPPVELTDAESELILYYGQKGKNEYINKLSRAKQDLAYALLQEVVHDNAQEIDNCFKQLLLLDPMTNKEETSWRRIRREFVRGEDSEYTLIPCLNALKTKSIHVNSNHENTLNTQIDNIIFCFQTCKAIVKLTLFKHKVVEGEKIPTPSKEQIKEELDREESRFNRKTTTLVNDFNKRSDDYWKEVEAEERANPKPRRMRMGRK